MTVEGQKQEREWMKTLGITAPFSMEEGDEDEFQRFRALQNLVKAHILWLVRMTGEVEFKPKRVAASLGNVPVEEWIDDWIDESIEEFLVG